MINIARSKTQIVGVVGDVRRDMEGHHYAGNNIIYYEICTNCVQAVLKCFNQRVLKL